MRNIRKHPNHVVLALGLIAIGIWLVINDRFFNWPPGQMAVAVENDDLWGYLLVLIGLAILSWVLFFSHSIRMNSVLLVIAIGVLAFLSVYEFIIWLATGSYQGWISNSIITAFVMVMAMDSDTRRGSDKEHDNC